VIVIDASALVKYILREEGWEEVSSIIKEKKPLYSVDHLLKEVGNAIWKHYHVRRLIRQEDALKLYHGLVKLVNAGVIVLEPESKYIKSAMQIALKYGITIYDSLYLAQAQELGELLTSDRKQADVASQLNLKVRLIA